MRSIHRLSHLKNEVVIQRTMKLDHESSFDLVLFMYTLPIGLGISFHNPSKLGACSLTKPQQTLAHKNLSAQET